MLKFKNMGKRPIKKNLSPVVLFSQLRTGATFFYPDAENFYIKTEISSEWASAINLKTGGSMWIHDDAKVIPIDFDVYYAGHV